MLFTAILKLRSLMVRRPSRKLTWTVMDFEWGRKYALSQPHPFMKNKTLWDLVYDKRDSVNTIDNINKWIFNEI